MSEEILMTSEGYNKLKEDLEYLRTTKRDEIADKIRVALGFGDLSENSEYDEAKNDQGMVEAQIARLEDQLKKAKIIDESLLSKDIVGIGSTVHILDVEFEEEMTYKIVTSAEANHSLDETISDESPVGKALIGHKVGDDVEAILPNGNKAHYRILNISL